MLTLVFQEIILALPTPITYLSSLLHIYIFTEAIYQKKTEN